MRVTQNMKANNFIGYIHKQTEDLLKIQKTIASQKRVTRISDDPVGMSHVLSHRTRLALINQYQENIDQGITRLEFNELTLNLAADLVNTARQVAEAHVGLDVSPEDKQLAANQVKDVYDHAIGQLQV